MPAGTITLTSGSTAVTGTGTNFATELKVNDLMVAVVGGVTYTLGVQAVGSATALTLTTAFNGPTTSGLAWTALPNSALVGITAQVAADVAKAIRGFNLDKVNWQKIFSSDTSVTVTMPDLTKFTGPSWGYLADQLQSFQGSIDGKASKGANSDITSLSGLTTALSIEQGGTGAKTRAAAWSAIATYGTGAGTAAQGNDSRITGAMQSSGGTFTGPVNSSSYIRSSQGLTATGNGVPLTQQGTHISWNENSGTGRSSIVNNRGGGTGGLDIRMINQANSSESAKFAFDIDGAFRAPNGSYSVGGRVRLVSAIASNYIAIDVDGNQKGINFFDSDERLKEEVVDADQDWAIDALRLIRPVSFKYKDYIYSYMSPDPITGEEREAEGVQEGGVHKFGVIAQEIEKVYPEMVITNGDGMKALDPLEAIGWLLAICRKQQSTIDDIGIKLSNLDIETDS